MQKRGKFETLKPSNVLLPSIIADFENEFLIVFFLEKKMAIK